MLNAPHPREQIAALRAQLAVDGACRGPSLAFGIDAMDGRLADHGLDSHALHEIAPASPALSDDAAATLFTAGLAARFAEPGGTVLWAVTRFDLYAPGLDQSGLPPERLLFSEAREDNEVLALAEDGLRSGTLAAVVAEVNRITMTATRRLQLAAAEGQTPMLLFRRWRRRAVCPLSEPSASTTRWRIRSHLSEPLGHAGIGRARWEVDLVRQRNGNSFSLILDACDDTGRLALPAPTRHRAAGADRTTARAA
jgi:protein ImuA